MITALIALADFALFVAGMLHEARAQERADAGDDRYQEQK